MKIITEPNDIFGIAIIIISLLVFIGLSLKAIKQGEKKDMEKK